MHWRYVAQLCLLRGLNGAMQVAQQTASTRFPRPVVLSFVEGTSQARYMSALMVPSHKVVGTIVCAVELNVVVSVGPS